MMSIPERPSTLKRLMAQWVWLMASMVLAWAVGTSTLAASPHRAANSGRRGDLPWASQQGAASDWRIFYLTSLGVIGVPAGGDGFLGLGHTLGGHDLRLFR